ncbi:hypothetical protein E2C01_019597 [Portunus trituberculatus]|uniref:Uncharacterized protein n=1 Tax=Portunus trituberculatus TaxID=210409 RepID=A0A5B7DYC9_PORTR|nr:hypothetical protein [Portunus trituberculatus]
MHAPTHTLTHATLAPYHRSTLHFGSSHSTEEGKRWHSLGWRREGVQRGNETTSISKGIMLRAGEGRGGKGQDWAGLRLIYAGGYAMPDQVRPILPTGTHQGQTQQQG